MYNNIKYIHVYIYHFFYNCTYAGIREEVALVGIALSAVIGPWCHTMGQTMRGTIHPCFLTLDQPPYSIENAREYRSFTGILFSILLFLSLSHPAFSYTTISLRIVRIQPNPFSTNQLNKHNSWLGRPAVTMRSILRDSPDMTTSVYCILCHHPSFTHRWIISCPRTQTRNKKEKKKNPFTFSQIFVIILNFLFYFFFFYPEYYLNFFLFQLNKNE